MVIFFILLLLNILCTHASLEDNDLRHVINEGKRRSHQLRSSTIAACGNFRKKKRPRNPTLLHAAKRNNIEEVTRLLKTQNPNQADAEGNTALHLTTSRAIAEILLRHPVRADLRNHMGQTALQVAQFGLYKGVASAIKKHFAELKLIKRRSAARIKIAAQVAGQKKRSRLEAERLIEEACSICLEPPTKELLLVPQYNCPHHLHKTCYTKFKTTATHSRPYWECPICRAQFSATVSEKEKAEAQKIKDVSFSDWLGLAIVGAHLGY